MSFGEVFGKAWNILWNHKILWLFGLLAGAVSSGSPNFNFNFNQNDLARGEVNLPPELANFFTSMDNFFARATPAFYAFLIIVGLLLFIISIYLGIMGRLGLMRGAWLADTGDDAFGLGRLWDEASGYFWRQFGLGLMLGIQGFAALLVLFFLFFFGFTSSLSANNNGNSLLLLCIAVPVCCLLVPFFWMLEVWGELATAALVGENVGVFAALGRGWKALRSWLGGIVIMGVGLWLLQLVVGILLSLPVFALLIPLLMRTVTTGKFLGGANVSVLLIFMAVYIPLTWFIGSLLRTYIGSIWTLTYRRIVAPPEAFIPAPPVVQPDYPQGGAFDRL